MYKILKNIIEMDDYSVQKLSNLQPPEPFEWNTVEGTELNVSDCIGGKGKIEVKGNTEQKQLSGKNLFDKDNPIEKRGSINNNNIFRGGGGNYCIVIPCKPNTTYTAQKRNDGDTNRLALASCETNPSDTADVDTPLLNNVRNDSAGNLSITTGSTANYIIMQYYRNVESTLTKQQILDSIQIEEGSTATDYEPYCGGQPSPNPDYPQEIKVVTGDNVVKNCGKNLFDKNNANKLNGGYIDIYTNKIVTSNNARCIYIPIKENCSYTVSKKVTNYSHFRIATTQDIPTIGSTVSDLQAGDGNTTSLTLTSSLKSRYLVVWWGRVDYDNEDEVLGSLQIEEGSTPTPYEPYRGEKYEVYLPSLNKNILDTRYTKVGSVNAETGEYVYNSNNLMGENYIKVEPNTTYCLSGNTTFSGIRLSEYDENKTHIKRSQSNSPAVVITTTANTHYVRWSFNYNSQPVDINLAKTLELQLELGNLRTSFIECEPLELCKIDDYEDILFKNEVGDENYNAELEDGAWYKKSAIAEVILDGKETWNYNSGNRYFFTNKFLDNYVTQYTKLVSNNYIGGMASNGGLYNNHIQTGTAYSFMICDNRFTDKNDLKTWLSTHNTIVKYPLATPTYEKITETTLISQLEALRKAKWFKGVNHWWTETNNLEPVLKGTYRQAINE